MKIDENVICDLITNINQCTNWLEVLKNATNFFEKMGVIYFNYTELNTQYGNKIQNFLKHHNYTDEWVKTYTKKNYSSIDPALIYGKIYQKTAEWNYACSVVSKNFTLNKDQTELLKDMMLDVAKNNLLNGIGIPIYKTISNQYGFYIVFPTSQAVPKHNILEAICYIINNAFVTFSEAGVFYENEKFPFSPQERELIKLIYNGKERQDIAEIMTLSINTIDTMTKRVFVKMRVNSKVQLIAKIIAKGWLGMLT